MPMDKAIQIKDISDEEIIAACRQFHAGRCRGQTPDESIAHKYPVKVVIRKMEQMIDRGILDCGVSTRTAWVVADKGA